jgi:uncharacterized membrane protein YvlD (DUF360 family)
MGQEIEQLLRFDLTYWVTQTLAMALTVLLLPNLRVTSIFGPILAVVSLSFINTTLWSSDLFLQIPGSVSTQTITLFAINGAIFWAIVKLLPGIESKGIFPVLAAPIVFTVCAMIIPQISARVDWGKVRIQAGQLYSETRKFVDSQSLPHEESKSNR